MSYLKGIKRTNRHIPFRAAICLVLLCLALNSLAEGWFNQDKTTIYYPGSVDKNRSDYTLEILQLALNASDTAYKILPSDIVSPKSRNFTLLEQSRGIDIVWSMTNHDREARFLPIRIPIFKGLSGWRIPLVHADNKDILSSVASIEDLRKFSIGQMYAWTDAKILQHNQFNVDSGPSYEAMFRMLSAKRFDLFPRSALEALSEYKTYRDSAIEIDPNIVIYYPTAMYFFVNKSNTRLANDLKTGLETLIANGKFDSLFNDHYAESIYNAKLQHRTIIRLENPFLPDTTPRTRAELWYSP